MRLGADGGGSEITAITARRAPDLRKILVLRGMAEHGKKRYFRPSDLPELFGEIKRLPAPG